MHTLYNVPTDQNMQTWIEDRLASLPKMQAQATKDLRLTMDEWRAIRRRDWEEELIGKIENTLNWPDGQRYVRDEAYQLYMRFLDKQESDPDLPHGPQYGRRFSYGLAAHAAMDYREKLSTGCFRKLGRGDYVPDQGWARDLARSMEARGW